MCRDVSTIESIKLPTSFELCLFTTLILQQMLVTPPLPLGTALATSSVCGRTLWKQQRVFPCQETLELSAS